MSEDTASIVADVIASNEEAATSEPVAVAADPAVVADPVADPAAAAAAAQKVVTDPDDLEQIPAERVDALGRKRETGIPHSQVKRIAENREKKVIAAIAKELGITKAEAELRLEDVTGALSTSKSELSNYRSTVEAMAETEQLMASDADAFIERLASVFPQYKKFLADPAAAERPAAVSTEMPKPNYKLPDGSMTYDLDGIQELMKWQAAQVEERLTKRYAPIEETVKGQQEQRQYDEFVQGVEQKVNETAAEARTWAMFKEHEADILKLLREDSAKAKAERRVSTLTLEAAYRQIVIPKLTADQNAVRERVLAEIKAQPRSTSAPLASVKADEKAVPQSTADIVRGIVVGR